MILKTCLRFSLPDEGVNLRPDLVLKDILWVPVSESAVSTRTAPADWHFDWRLQISDFGLKKL